MKQIRFKKIKVTNVKLINIEKNVLEKKTKILETQPANFGLRDQ